MGLVDEHHVWILPEMNLNDIWKVAINNNYSNCSVDVLKMSLNNALMVGADYENGTDQNINVLQLHCLVVLILLYIFHRLMLVN